MLQAGGASLCRGKVLQSVREEKHNKNTFILLFIAFKRRREEGREMLQVTECGGLAPGQSREQGKAAQAELLGVQGNKLKGKRMNSIINISFKRLGLT